MFSRSLVIFFLGFFSITSFAQNIKLEAKFQVYAEYEEIELPEVMSQGWVLKEGEYGDTVYFLAATIAQGELPFKRYVGPSYLEINESGLMRLGMIVGDADASTGAELQLPLNNDQLLAFSPLVISVSGGDHASGLWGFHGTVTIIVE